MMIEEIKDKINIYIVDAFTKESFKGNPAAICIDFLNEKNSNEKDILFQKIANEMSVSETAFITKNINENNIDNKNTENYFLQWFTPITEIDLCGHATLAMSHILFEKNKNIKKIIFGTKKSGNLEVIKDDNNLLQLNFPLGEPHIINLKDNNLQNIKQDLNINNILDIYLCKKTKKLLLRVETIYDLLNIDKNKIFNLSIEGYQEIIKGIIVTTNDNKTLKEYNNYDFISRYFAPWVGVLEDPVTGSAHTVLSKFWSDKLNKDKFIAFQRSDRGGVLYIENKGNRVLISGNAITVLKGELNINR